MPDTALPGPGHNQPPSDGDLLLVRLAETYADMVKRAEDLCAAAGRLPTKIEDEETAGRCSAFAKQIKAHEKAVEDSRKAEKGVYDDFGRLVQDFFVPRVNNLKSAKDKTNGLLLAWDRELERRAEEARRVAEAEAKRQREEAEKLAAAAQTEADLEKAVAAETAAVAIEQKAAAVTAPAPIRSAYGSTSSRRRTPDFEITDAAALPRHLLMPNEAAIKAHMKGAPKDALPAPVPGLRFFWSEQMVTR